MRLLLGLSLTLRALDACEGLIGWRLLLGAEDRWCSWVLLRGRLNGERRCLC